MQRLFLPLAAALLAACSPTPSFSPPTASLPPIVTAEPTVAARTFVDGEHHIGSQVIPGTYRTVKAPSSNAEDFCSWERVSGFGGSEAELIANSAGVGPRVVTIAASDAGFISENCGTWTSDLAPLPGPVADGVWIVATEVQPGRYSSEGGAACVWQRLSGFGGTSDESVEVGFTGTVEILATDVGFSSSHCGTWVAKP
jgi:hypothetical protein